MSEDHRPESDVETTAKDWLFQCNPKRYDLAALIDRGVSEDVWAMNQHGNLVSPGDRVFFWQAGKEARLLAVGHVTSPRDERESSFGRYCVDIAFDYKLVPPLTRSEALDNATLARFQPFTRAQGTNFPIKDLALVAALEQIIKDRLIPVAAKQQLDRRDETFQELLDAAIKRATRSVKEGLQNYIAQMDPFAFEWLVRAVFLKLGYKNISVTKRSGDGGIDITATLAAGGVANIRTCVR